MSGKLPNDGRTTSTKKVNMSKRARAAARKRLPGRIATGKPTTMPSSNKRIPAGVDPTQNNPNDIGAAIIPQTTSLP